ncbi:hypothetical protein VO63_30935 [Streptomyces showdoensis]|uniref:Uncharacterized protein n=1 Tax=Streptomyces showdoensis TaxID=68268 RepID=A0A2P2GES7_STREW|nr:hypothetical protein VO63_30935 [Streptomyces showdoensis]
MAEALDGWSADRPTAERARAGAEHPEPASLLPSLGLVHPEAGHGPEEERDRLFRARAGPLGESAEERPVMLVPDDLHAADAGSFRLHDHLPRRAREDGRGLAISRHATRTRRNSRIRRARAGWRGPAGAGRGGSGAAAGGPDGVRSPGPRP